MSDRDETAFSNPAIRRVFEEELLVNEATDTVAGLLASLGISQKELAKRLSVSPGRVSQVLSGAENLTLKSLGALGWALGVRFDLTPSPMADRKGTPATDDPPPPAWLNRLRPEAAFSFETVSLPPAGKISVKPSLRVVNGEVRAA